MINAYGNTAMYAPFPVNGNMTPTLFAVESLSYTQYQYQGQSQPVFQQNTSGSSSDMMMQMFKMLLPMLLDNNSNNCKSKAKTTTEQVEVSDDSRGAWGDPHYSTKGKNGKDINFTHNGQSGHTYNVFQGDGYEVQGKYDKYGHDINDIVNTSVKAGKDTIEYGVDGKTKINGKVVNNGTISLNDGTRVQVQGNNMTILSRDGDSSISFNNSDGVCVDPKGKFSKLGGILGTAIDLNRGLSEDEANKFDLTATKKAAQK